MRKVLALNPNFTEATSDNLSVGILLNRGILISMRKVLALNPNFTEATSDNLSGSRYVSGSQLWLEVEYDFHHTLAVNDLAFGSGVNLHVLWTVQLFTPLVT